MTPLRSKDPYRPDPASALQMVRRQRGIILPFVLVSIVSVSIIAASAFAILSRSTDDMRRLDEAVAEEIALISAESQVTVAFLTAQSATDGLALSPFVSGSIGNTDATSQEDLFAPFGSIINTETLDPARYWSARGGIRIAQSARKPIRVHFQDVAGMFPISRAEEALVEKFLRIMGFRSDLAEEMAARIGDYQDSDSVRRPGGGERSDYRLFNNPPPSNSPLRTPEELGQVLGMFEAAPPQFWREIMTHASVHGTSLSSDVVLPKLKPLVETGFAGAGETDGLAALSLQTSPRARFLLSVPGNGRRRQRAIEIHRASNIAQTPYERYWIYERTEPLKAPPEQNDQTPPILFPYLQDTAEKR